MQEFKDCGCMHRMEDWIDDLKLSCRSGCWKEGGV